MSKDDFFIGWSPDMPQADRRFFLTAGLAGVALTGAIGAGAALYRRPPGRGTWAQDDVREWTGIVTANPYAMLRTADIDGAPKTALLSCLGKCGVAARIGVLEGQVVTVKGSLIQRGRHAMIAVVDGMDWIAPAEARPTKELAFPDIEPIGEVSLSGEILDSKCWFGAMRPSEGKVHKSCAALCIRGGLPPAFFAKDKSGRGALMIMTKNGQSHSEDLLSFVADPVKVTATAHQWGDLILLDGPVSAIRRL